MYNSIVSLICEYVFSVASTTALTASQAIAVDIIATTGCLLIFFIPFYIVYRILKLIA